jgi:putative acetyltransferase
MRVALEPPNQPEVISLIADLDAYQDTLYPAEARYALDLASLAKPNVLFAVARTPGGAAVGCGAVVLNCAYGEVKRMYVQPESRGHGVARLIIATLESVARAQGCTALMLETGPYQAEALAFYSRQGYERCGPFGEYPEHPLSVFMCKQLATAPVSTKS